MKIVKFSYTRPKTFIALVLFLLSFLTTAYTNTTYAISVTPCDPNDPARIRINDFRAANDVLYFDDCADQCSTSSNISASSSSLPSVAGDGGGCGSDDINQNKQQIWGFLKNKGLNDEAAAGIMGNLEQESSFNSKAINPIGCVGIAQWCGTRINDLKNYATERGKESNCLGLQLEFMWYEITETDQGQFNALGEKLEIPLVEAMSGKSFSRKNQYTGSNPYNAAGIFHDYFERADKSKGEDKGRGERAERLFTELSGNVVTNPGDSTRVDCAYGQYGGGIPSEECVALIAQYKALDAAGRIKQYGSTNRDWIYKDLENCTTNPIQCGTGGGKGGVNPRILRAVVAAAANSGAVVEQWNFNTGHDCDGLNHPRGMGSDLKCDGNKSNSQETATSDCNRLFIYLYNNYEELGLTELIWQYPPPGYSCSDPKIICDVPGHADHIHIGAYVSRDV